MVWSFDPYPLQCNLFTRKVITSELPICQSATHVIIFIFVYLSVGFCFPSSFLLFLSFMCVHARAFLSSYTLCYLSCVLCQLFPDIVWTICPLFLFLSTPLFPSPSSPLSVYVLPFIFSLFHNLFFIFFFALSHLRIRIC